MASISEPHFSGWTGTHILVQPPTDTFHLWAQLFGVELRPEVQPPIDGFHLWTSLFGVELEPTSWFNPLLVPFMSEHKFSGLNSDPRFNPPFSEPGFSGSLNPLHISPDIPLEPTSWFNPPLVPFISEHNFSGLNSDPRFNPPLMAFISEPHFSGLNWNPHPGSTPHWYLSSLSTTFRGWTQTRGSTPIDGFHLWTSLFGVELEPTSWFNPPLVPFIPEHNFSGLNSDTRFNPPLMAFISEPHLSGLNPLPIAPDIPLRPTSWFNPPLIPFISEHNFSGLNSDPRFNPPLMAFISEPHFSGLNWNPHPGSTPHWYLSSLSTTFRGWTQTHGSTPTDGFHLWTSLFGVELEPTSGFNPPLVPFISEHNFSGLNSDARFNPPLMAFISEPHLSGLNWNPHPGSTPTGTFHLWAQLFGVELRREVQPPIGGFHLWTSLIGIEPIAHSTRYSTATHILVQPPADTFHLWAQLFGVELRPEVQPPIDGFHLWTSFFGVELEPTSWFNPPLVPFISEHNFSGLNSDTWFNPHWWLSSLNLTFRGWTGTHILVQPPTGTFHLWAQLFGVELRREVQPPIDGFHLWTSLIGIEPIAHSTRYSTATHILAQPPADTFHLWAQLFGVELRPEVQPPIDGFHLWTSLFGVELEPTSWFNPPLVPFISEHNFSGLNSDTWFNPHWWLSSLNLTFRGWTGTHILVQPRIDTFHLWAQLFGVELRPQVQPPTDGFHLWTSLFRGWTHAHTNQYGIWRQLASINLLSTKQTAGIQTETEPISGSFTLREPKRTQTNQRLTALYKKPPVALRSNWGYTNGMAGTITGSEVLTIRSMTKASQDFFFGKLSLFQQIQISTFKVVTSHKLHFKVILNRLEFAFVEAAIPQITVFLFPSPRNESIQIGRPPRFTAFHLWPSICHRWCRQKTGHCRLRG